MLYSVFWVVMPCNVAVGYQRFGGPYCFHLQGEVNGAVKGTQIQAGSIISRPVQQLAPSPTARRPLKGSPSNLVPIGEDWTLRPTSPYL
jgi:hypothetical protein